MPESVLSLILILPFMGALLIGVLGFIFPELRKAEKLIGGFATLMVAIPFVLIVNVFLNYQGPVTFELFPFFGGEHSYWIHDGSLQVNFAYSLDHLSLIMGMIVTGVGALIHLYSIGYMHGDRGYYKFFLYLNLFIFAMLNLVLGDNMVVMFLGWEGVGACSYFLIGFWYEDMQKAFAAQKAFIANRIGDFAMLAAMFIVYDKAGTLTFQQFIPDGELLPVLSQGYYSILGMEVNAAMLVALLVFIAATGKSAQIPLYVWLPDAMAGPTPVSALIHAATMVTSGIYLIARMGDVFIAAPGVMVFVSIVGAATALLAALIAIGQNDIKKVLAYSTVSQLGFMFMALGAGAFTTAIFHVMTHAFFKACLFLGSGSVIHAMEHMHTVKDPQDVRTMGNLKKYMPSTHITFLISTLAIAGIPLLSGFFSKDEILGKTFAAGFDANGSNLYFLVWAIGVGTAALTAFYMTRVYFLTFRGKERFPDSHQPHESSAWMTVPLWVLGILAIVGGYLGLPEVLHHGHYNWISHHWLNGTVQNMPFAHISATMEYGLIALSIVIAIAGVVFAWSYYSKNSVEGDTKLAKMLGGFYTAMQNKFYVDELYEKTIINPFVFAGEKIIMAFDKNVIDGLVNGAGQFVLYVGNQIKRLQTGLVTQYALLVVAGVVLILTYLLLA